MTLRDLIAEQLNLSSVSPAEGETFLARLEDVILRETTLQVLESLPEADRVELETIMSEADDATILAFIRSKISGFDELQKRIVEDMLGQVVNGD